MTLWSLSGHMGDHNPAPYDGNLDPNSYWDRMELNSKNGFKNYDYVPLSPETLDWLRENDTSLNLMIEGPGKLPDIQIGRSVGAKAKNYEITTPYGDTVYLTEGSRITKVNVIAGKGMNRQIDMVDDLVYRYGGNASEWQKCKGLGYVDVDGDSVLVELHWYSEPTVGKVNFKIKEAPGGGW